MANNNYVSAGDVLLPVLIISLVLFFSLGFQATQILRDRDALHQFIAQQDKPLEDSRKLQVQLTALALGTKKLADGGDKRAAAIIARMQQLGITVGGGPNPPPAIPEAATPPGSTPPSGPADPIATPATSNPQ